MRQIHFGENLSFLKSLPDNSVELVIIDPTYGTGKVQKRKQIKTIATDEDGQVRFSGKRYTDVLIGETSYNDNYDDYLGFIYPRLIELHRILTPNGSFYTFGNYQNIHYVKILLDEIFGMDNFLNHIIWVKEYGSKSKTKWSQKHEDILYYVKDNNNYTFNWDVIDRIPYLAPDLVSPEKREKGKPLLRHGGIALWERTHMKKQGI